MLARLIALPDVPVEPGKANIAVRDEGAHAEILRERHGVAVVSRSTLAFREVAMGGDLPEETQRPCLVSSFPPFAGEREGTLGRRECVHHFTGQQASFAVKDDEERVSPQKLFGGCISNALREDRQRTIGLAT